MLRSYPLWLFATILVGCLLGTTQAQQSSAAAIDLDRLNTCNFTSDVEVSSIRLGAAILNLETGTGCTEELDEPFPVASVPKLFVLGAYLEEVAMGWRDFSDTVTFTSDYVMGGSSDCLSYDDIDRQVTTGYLADIMIWCSDNSATWLLMDIIGREAIQEYIDRLGIDGIGPIIPYAEVDRTKLSFIDPTWEDVPLSLASQFYRNGNTTGLVPVYFSERPFYSRQERLAASARYFASTDYNTITPRAMAEYLLLMHERLNSSSLSESLAAWWFFGTMMLTQRQYTAQDIPGTIYVGAKNGFDVGLKAEVSVSFRSLTDNKPEALIVVFVHQQDMTAGDVSIPRRETDALNRYLASISPQIRMILYPDEPVPSLSVSSNIVSVTFASEDDIETCREESDGSTRDAYLRALSACWHTIDSVTRLPVGERLGLGIVLRELRNQEAHITMVFHAPDGRQFAYQYNTRFVDGDNVYWYHRLDTRGTWHIEIYQDLELVYTESIEAF